MGVLKVQDPPGSGNWVPVVTAGGGGTDSTPLGAIMGFAPNSATVPTGWLLCDGTAVNRSTYAALFTAIGTTYGVGDGSTTFNLPDLRGRVPVGLNTSGLFVTRGAALGAETVTLTTAEMPIHTHGVSAGVFITKGGTQYYFNQGATTADRASDAAISNAGGGGAHANVQPSLVINYIIKAVPTTGAPATDTGWLDLTNTLGAGTVQYRVKNGAMHVRVNSTAATNSGTTYTIVASGGVPLAYRPSKNARGACDFSGFPGTLLVAPDGSVLVSHNSGALRNTIDGAANYPV